MDASKEKASGDYPNQNQSPALNNSNVFRPRSTGSWSTMLGVGNLASLGNRRKTFSESSETSSVGDGPLDLSSPAPNIDLDPRTTNRSPSPLSSRLNQRSYSESHSENQDQNLTFGNSSQVVYDIDGKFPYTYYERKPVLYDIDGTHRYKYYKAFTPTPYTQGAPHHEKRPWIYDPAQGMVTCLTTKDLKPAKQ